MILKEVMEVVENENIKDYLKEYTESYERISYKIILNIKNKLIIEELIENISFGFKVYCCYKNEVLITAIGSNDISCIVNSMGLMKPIQALNEVMTFGEACEKWGISESSLRMKVARGTLEEHKEYRKSGKKINLITTAAMKKYYKDREN